MLECGDYEETDIPKVWEYLAEMIGPTLQDDAVAVTHFNDMCERLNGEKAGKFRAKVLHIAPEEGQPQGAATAESQLAGLSSAKSQVAEEAAGCKAIPQKSHPAENATSRDNSGQFEDKDDTSQTLTAGNSQLAEMAPCKEDQPCAPKARRSRGRGGRMRRKSPNGPRVGHNRS